MATQSLTPRFRFDSDAGHSMQLSSKLQPCRLARLVCVGVLICGLVAAGAARSSAQTGPPQDATAPINPGAPPSRAPGPLQQEDARDPLIHKAEQRMIDRRNEERQKNLVVDTDKLLALAQQLKTEVDKSTKDQLSVDVFKRAEQIEKLARSVKEKMRGY